MARTQKYEVLIGKCSFLDVPTSAHQKQRTKYWGHCIAPIERAPTQQKDTLCCALVGLWLTAGDSQKSWLLERRIISWKGWGADFKRIVRDCSMSFTLKSTSSTSRMIQTDKNIFTSVAWYPWENWPLSCVCDFQVMEKSVDIYMWCFVVDILTLLRGRGKQDQPKFEVTRPDRNTSAAKWRQSALRTSGNGPRLCCGQLHPEVPKSFGQAKPHANRNFVGSGRKREHSLECSPLCSASSHLWARPQHVTYSLMAFSCIISLTPACRGPHSASSVRTSSRQCPNLCTMFKLHLHSLTRYEYCGHLSL